MYRVLGYPQRCFKKKKEAIIINIVVILKCNPLHHTVQPWNQGSVLRNILYIVKAK